MLECKSLSLRYGQHQALNQVSLNIGKGEIVVILGANGAGKTSLINALAGRVKTSEASQVSLDGVVITRLPPNRIVEMGLALVPEGRGIFADLSVMENLTLGAYAHRARNNEQRNLDEVFTLFPRLAERKNQLAGTMSGGEQQMVAIGRALMSDPEFLMLDEPSLGLSPILCSELFQSLKAVQQTGVGILLVEQNARQALAIADRGYLLENGQIIGEGSAYELLHDEAVKAAYLGGAASRSDVLKEAIEHPREFTSRNAAPAMISPAEIAAEAVKSAQQRIQPTTRPHTTSADDLLRGLKINELVTRAGNLSKQKASEQAQQHRPVYSTPARIKPAARPPASPQVSLESILSDIEKAAQRARSARQQNKPLQIERYDYRERKNLAPATAHEDRSQKASARLLSRPAKIVIYKRDPDDGRLKQVK